ncbi:YDG domain-containing protein [Fimbriiglobus ruber]|uniref:Lead, cadmium, zinc and mercury transporting ATPase n=1 Tax=Fimbriiglobus ruber TaxID=1908690 RepID=A0A225DJ72_9BACT|nr:YDG domain-containing protein [Fimbriiglobus ruber]OWK36435.1 Lead, cadmium, zinc and mercury transporting ATPase [Fimbriiglobus ruber]
MNSTGIVALGNAALNVLVGSSPSLSVGQTFTIITGTSVSGVFGNTSTTQGTTVIAASDNPSYVFAVTYNASSVVLTLAAVTGPRYLAIVNGGNTISYTTASGIDSTLSVSVSNGDYVLTDTSGPISLDQSAITAGWTLDATQTIATGPMTDITAFAVNTSDGNDTINGFNSNGAAVALVSGGTLTTSGTITTGNLSFSGSATLNLGGTITATGNIAAAGVSAVNLSGTVTASGTETLTAPVIAASAGAALNAATLNLTDSGTSSIGSATSALPAQAGTIAATAGSGGVYLAVGTGASVTASAAGAGNVSVVNGSGALTIGAAGITTAGGNIALASGDDVILGAAGTTGGSLNAGSGTITIAANTDGTGNQGYNQNGASLTTTNTTAAAVSITVNTASGGTGNAVIGQGIVGSNTGGGYAVTNYGGNILWSSDSTYTYFAANTAICQGINSSSNYNTADSGNDTQTLHAYTYTFTTGSTGSVGTSARPLQTDNYGTDGAANSVPNLTASAGSGGVYVVDWDAAGSHDLTTGAIAAAGAGGILVATANASGHNLWIEGNVSSGSGTIFLGSDDDLHIGPGVVIGGAGFSGTVFIETNRDHGTAGQNFVMDPTSSIITSNATNVFNANDALLTGADGHTPTTQAVYIDISGSSGATPAHMTLGNITAGNGGLIDINAIPNGLPTPAGSSSSLGGQIAMAGAANVLDAGPTGTIELIAGYDDSTTVTSFGDAIGSATLPVAVAGGNVLAYINYGNVTVTGTAATNYTVTEATLITGQAGAGAPPVVLSTTAGVLTVAGATNNVGGGTISLTSTGTGGGVNINAPLGGAATGLITINAGSNPATLNSTLPLTPTSTVAVTAANNALVVSSTGTVTGTGAATNATPLTVQSGGAITPGGAGTVGTLNVGNTVIPTGGVLNIDLNSTSSFDELNASGTVDVTGSTLNLNVLGSPNVGDQFLIVNNDGTDAVVGQFAGGATITAANNSQYIFTINYAGGDGNDIVATVLSTTGTTTTTTAVTTSLASPEVYGTQITFTATVTATSGSTAPTAGSVQFFDNGVSLGTTSTIASTNGNVTTFTFTTSATQLQVNGGAAHDISATYTPGTGFATSSSSGAGDVSETITPFTLTISGVTANNKVYDGTANATLNTSSAALVGVFSGDTVTLGTSGATGTFAGKDVGTGLTVTAAGFTLGGAQAGDYTLTQPTTTADITPFGLTISGVTASDKVYDSTTNATLNTGSATLTGVFSGDTVTLGTSGATGTFAGKDVGTGIIVTTAGFTLGGAQAGDYTVTQPTATANITPFTLTVSGVTANNKVYDSTTAATLNTSSAALVGVFSGDTVTLNSGSASGTFAQKDVGTGLTVTTAGFTLGGAQAGDYTVTQPTATASITPFALTISGVTANDKVYDSTTTATLNTGSLTLNGVFAGDTVAPDASSVIGTFASKDVASGIVVNVAGLALTGAQASDYTLTQPTTTASITPATLTVSGVTANDKVYDAATDATLNASSAALVGVFSGDVVTLDASGATGTFAAKDVGSGLAVTTTGFAIGGAQAGDYTLTQPTPTANVTPLALTITAVANTKIYDGTTSAAAVPQVTSGAVLGGDTANFIETYDTPSIGTGKTLTPSGTVEDGVGGADYSYTFVPVPTGSITTSITTTTAVSTSQQTVTYGTTVTLTATVTATSGTPTGGVMFYDDTTGTLLGVGTLQSQDSSSATWTFTTGQTQLGVIPAPNHAIRAVFSPAGQFTSSQGSLPIGETIAPFTLTLNGVAANTKVYDQTTAATLNSAAAMLNGVFAGDTVNLDPSGATGSFVSKDVGAGIVVTTTGFALTGAQAGDYTLIQTTTAGTITPATLTVAGVTANTKVYDDTTAATLNTAAASLSGVFSGDAVTLVATGAAGTFGSKDASPGIAVATTGFTLSGTNASDYTLVQPTTVGTITPLTITVSGVTANNKVYDSTTTATLNTATATLVGVFSGDAVTLVTSGATGTFAMKDVGIGITVSTAGFTLSGAQASDYTLTQPTATANITPLGITVVGVAGDTKVYDSTTAATLNTAAATLVGVFGGDTVGLNVAAATGTFANKDVGTGITITTAGFALTGAQAGDYTLTQPTTTASITPFTLTVAGVIANGKVYDSTTTATLNTGLATLVGVFTGDTVGVNSAGAIGTFANKDVGIGLTVTTAGFTLTGAQASDYTLTQPTTTASITPFTLTVSGVTANNKVYDSTTAATLNTAAAALVGVFAGDIVSLNSAGATGTFASKDVDAGITVTTAGFALTGAQASDYTLTQPTTTANITPFTLTVSGVTANTKVYDSTTAAVLNTAAAILVGVFGGDTVGLNVAGAAGTFAQKDVGIGLIVTTAGFALTGAQADDYTLAQPTTTASITPFGLTISGVTANTKVYDSTTAAVLNTAAATLVGVFGGDTVGLNVTAADGTFAQKDVVIGITVTTAGFTLTGAQAGDYTLTQPTTTASITPFGLTISGMTASDKVYDSTTTADLNTGSAALVGVFSGDTVGLNSAGVTGTFADKAVGTGITVTTAGFALTGAQAGDYTLTQPTTTASITPFGLTISGVTASDKVYDSTTTADLNTGSATLVGVFSGDTVSLGTSGVTGAFAHKDVGTGMTVTTAGFALTGAQASDYTLAQPTTTANITPFTLTVSGVAANTKVYDSTTNATLNTGTATLVGVFGGDTVGLNVAAATGTFASKNVDTGIAVTTAGFALTGAQAGDYTLTQPTIAANITPATLIVSGVTAGNKVYDSTTNTTLNTGTATLVGVFAGDTVGLNVAAATGAFAQKDVGTGITVTTAGFALTGAQAGDYTLTQPTTTASITPATLAVSGVTADTKVYDSTTAATLNTGTAILVGVFSGDTVGLSTAGTTGTFVSKDVGIGITVTTAGFTLTGTQADDYTLTQPTTTASITPRAVTLTGVTADNKVYDATTTATLNTAAATLVGVLGGDAVSTDASGAAGTFVSKDVGAGINVTTAGFALTGVQAGDYTLTQPTTTASITPFTLTVAGITAADKVYDSTTNATLNTAVATLVGVLSGDVVALNTGGATGTFASASAGANIPVSVGGLSLSGAQAGDYTVTGTTAADITPRTLSISGVRTLDKVYDGTTNDTLDTTSAAVVGLLPGDSVSLLTTNAIGTFAGRNVGSGIPVTTAGFALGGAQAGDYALTFPSSTASIMPRPVIVTAAPSTKVYDGTTTSTAVPTVGSLGAGDTAAFTEVYDNPGVGTGKQMTPSGTVDDGNGGANYTFTFVPEPNGTITPSTFTTTTVTSSAPTVAFGSPVTLTATVQAGGEAPTGQVEFFDDATQTDLGAGVLQNTTADTAVWTLTPTSTQLTGGPHSIRAVFTPNGFQLATSSGNVSVTVTPTTTTTAVTAAADPVSAGQSATFTATVTAAAGTPTGSVLFSIDGGTPTPVALNGRTATLAVPGLSVGSHTVAATFQATGSYLTSSGTLAPAETVSAAGTATVLAIAPDTAASGSPVTLTATVTTTTSGAAAPTGTVTFTDQITGAVIATVPTAGGVATFHWTGVPATAQTIVAQYNGDANTTASTSAPQSTTAGSTSAGGESSTLLLGNSTIAVGADAGGGPVVESFGANGSPQLAATLALDASFTGGVRVATGDFNGDGVADIVVGSGPGTPNEVVILDGKTGAVITTFQPFEATFTGGVFVAVGDITGDGVPDLVVTPDQTGGPVVAVYDGAKLVQGLASGQPNGQPAQIDRFFGIQDPNFRGGARAAVGDVNGDGVADIVVSAGFGGGPRIAGFDGKSVASGAASPVKLFADFFAFEPSLTNGAYVAVGDVNGDGKADIVVGGGPGGAPRVTVFSGSALLDGTQTTIADFFAGDASARGGVRVAVKNLDGDADADVVVGSGAGDGSRVTAYTGQSILANPSDPTSLFDFDALPGFTGGVFVG